jgi:hypothetical protein
MPQSADLWVRISFPTRFASFDLAGFGIAGQLRKAIGEDMNRVLLIVGLLLLGGAYVGGYWPQHQKLLAVQQSASKAQDDLAAVQTVARMCRLENDLLALLSQTENQNYGDARGLSNTFFDNLRREADRDQNTSFKADLETILAQRDTVTAGLAKTDAATVTTLRQILAQMQQLMQKAASQANLGGFPS